MIFVKGRHNDEKKVVCHSIYDLLADAGVVFFAKGPRG
jgi:hypothetical protein